ncbi:hypothetical protein ACVBEF_02865 [Glaciimonas sp. GG7]
MSYIFSSGGIPMVPFLPLKAGANDSVIPSRFRNVKNVVDQLEAVFEAKKIGKRVREIISVKALDKMAVLVKLRGSRKDFEQVGLRCAFEGNTKKLELTGVVDLEQPPDFQELVWFSLDPKFTGSVVNSPDGNLVNLAELLNENNGEENSGTTVFINGGYFKHEDRGCPYPLGTPIGKVISDGKEIRCAPIPSEYEDVAIEIVFADRSSIQLWPVLAEEGVPCITQKMLDEDPRFKFPPIFSIKDGDRIGFGSVIHALVLNPRACMSLPNYPHPENRIRLVLAPARERNVQGYSLASLAQVMARINRLSKSNFAIAVDGGYSSTIGAIKQDHPPIVFSQAQDTVPRMVANYLKFTVKSDKKR